MKKWKFRDKKMNRKTMFIIGGVLAAVVLVAIIAVVIHIVRKKKKALVNKEAKKGQLRDKIMEVNKNSSFNRRTCRDAEYTGIEPQKLIYSKGFNPNILNKKNLDLGEPTPPNSESDTGGLGYYKNARQSLPVENGGPAAAVAENMPTTPQMFKPITPETDKDTSGENFVTSVIAGKREHPFILNIPSNNGNVKNNSSSSESESRSRFFGFMSSGGAKSQRIKDKTGHHKPTLSENPMFVSSMNINTLIAESNIALKSGGIRSSNIVGSSIIGGSGAGNGNGNSSEDFAVGDSQVGWSLPPNVA